MLIWQALDVPEIDEDRDCGQISCFDLLQLDSHACRAEQGKVITGWALLDRIEFPNVDLNVSVKVAEDCLTFSPPERASICLHLLEGGMAVKLMPEANGSKSADVKLRYAVPPMGCTCRHPHQDSPPFSSIFP